ncbi:MAG TPA: hypothetical protein GXX21_10665 [Syntrophomonadaceae bacterium]|nr:hypothetical protein [Syntrophomonadaceae bacterium]HHW29995.1 hypothetical protein [Syntrophomonadaceae bacterium]
MSGTWQDSLQRVLKISEAEIELWQKIADMVAGNYCKCIIHMMIKKAKSEMEALKMLLDMHEREPCDKPHKPGPDYSPGYDPGYKPGYDPDYAPGNKPGYDQDYDSGYRPGYDHDYAPGYKPGYDPGYSPGYKPGYGPDYGYGKDKDFDSVPYAEEDKEDK